MSTTITRELSAAVHEFVRQAIEGELPEEQQPGELAHALIAIAGHEKVDIEQVVEWIKTRPEDFTCRGFRHWIDRELRGLG